MHSDDPNKPWNEFWQEIKNILAGNSRHCPSTIYDFRGFVFTQYADFRRATFNQNAYFIRATFNHNADFSWATFQKNTGFALTNVAGVLDFRWVTIGNECTVLLHRVNTEAQSGLQLRLLGTLADRIRFEDVRWEQRPGGGLILQDERDLAYPNQVATHELIADAYRRLVNNFERARQYEWAEEAVFGEMEMRRRNPERFPLVRWSHAEGNGPLPRFRRRIGQYARKFYGLDKKEPSPNQAEQGPWWQRGTRKLWHWVQRGARWLGEHVSFSYLYFLLSRYGISYRRAIVSLCVLLLLFAALFTWAGVRPREADAGIVISWSRAWQQPKRWSQMKRAFWAGLMTTLETATLQREPAYRPANDAGRLLAVGVLVAIPGQLALLLLALRRRFRR
ncbi:MAG: pentapeptide repeat-containing protein [Firmicutes bacterium]|nr:pentapeptide repeat-containing protein [Bacillota bacterium]